MPPDISSRKKRTVSEPSSAPAGDHRKRRRNRTTQSCLNCHTSKRMCDRKRPCGRCTQLGLTGLCVYEVDDPTQRSATQDESSRLRQRVAELEGVIRELKNKPHPRWVQSGCSPGEEFEKWHSRAQNRTAPDQSSYVESTPMNPPSPPNSTSSSEKCDSRSISSSSSSQSPSISNIYCSPINTPPSPLSTPSPSISTPIEEFSRPLVSIAGDTQDFDLASIFSSYHGLMACEENPYGQFDGALRSEDEKDDKRDETCFIRHPGGYCRCLTETTGYNVVLELSLRLRKAADTLGHLAHHHIGSDCLLYQRITELDAYATAALGNIATPPEDLMSLQSQNGAVPSETTMLHTTDLYGHEVAQAAILPVSTISPQSLHTIRSWDFIQSDSPSACDDSFMTWEPPRRS